MNALLSFRVKKLVAQTNCPACGEPLIVCGNTDTFAISSFACGSEFIIANDEIVIAARCPAASTVAARHLNNEAAAEAAKAGAA